MQQASDAGETIRRSARAALDAGSIPQLIPVREVMRICSLSRTSLYVRLHQGTFPQPVKLSEDGGGKLGSGRGKVRWLLSEVVEWVNARAAARKARPADAVQQMPA